MILVFHVLGLAFLVSYHSEFINEFRLIVADPFYILSIPLKIMNCLKCSSFWIGLVLTDLNFCLSGFISLLAFLIDKYLLNTPIEL